MLGTRKSTEADKQHLVECHLLDEWHQDDAPVNDWLNATLTTFYDSRGPIFHMAFADDKDQTLRMHAQFDPRERHRTARAIPAALGYITELALTTGYQKLALWSKSPKLIAFMQRLGFTQEGEDYVLYLGSKTCH
jgi:hypothetical protein